MKTREGNNSFGGTDEFDTHCSENWILFLEKSIFNLILDSHSTLDLFKPWGNPMDFELLLPVRLRGTEGQLRKSHLQFERQKVKLVKKKGLWFALSEYLRNQLTCIQWILFIHVLHSSHTIQIFLKLMTEMLNHLWQMLILVGSCSASVKVFAQTPGGRYVLIIHFYVDLGQKMIQWFNSEFKTVQCSRQGICAGTWWPITPLDIWYIAALVISLLIHY